MLTFNSADELVALGRDLAPLLSRGDVLILDGPLGAGKTTFARGIGEGLSVRGPITSPTFVIARVHPALNGGPSLVHVDAYRLESLEDVDSLDLDASLDESVTVVEWGVGRVEQLADSYLLIRLGRPMPSTLETGSQQLEVGEDEERSLHWLAIGPNWTSRIPGLAQVLGESQN